MLRWPTWCDTRTRRKHERIRFYDTDASWLNEGRGKGGLTFRKLLYCGKKGAQPRGWRGWCNLSVRPVGTANKTDHLFIITLLLQYLDTEHALRGDLFAQRRTVHIHSDQMIHLGIHSFQCCFAVMRVIHALGCEGPLPRVYKLRPCCSRPKGCTWLPAVLCLAGPGQDFRVGFSFCASAFRLLGAKLHCEVAILRLVELVGDGAHAIRAIWWLRSSNTWGKRSLFECDFPSFTLI